MAKYPFLQSKSDHKLVLNLACLVLSVFDLLSFCPSLNANAQTQKAGFALHDGDRVVFYGDSITAQRLYTAYLQAAVRAHFPDWNIRFYNAGVGGDSVRGGVAGKIDERIDRDVLKFQPTVVTIMLGMNDRSHPSEYEAGYEHILQRLRERSPQLRITVLGPTPMDGITTGKPSDNAELQSFLEIDRRLASKYGAIFIDLQTPVLTTLERAEKLNHLAAVSLIPDRIHPQSPIHMLMAETILAGWNYPRFASKVSIDAVTSRIVQQEGARVSNVFKNEHGIRWTMLESADEIRFVPIDGNEILYRHLIGTEHIGAKSLEIKSLPPGHYALLIDGKPQMLTWSQKELELGVRLDMLGTPAHRAGVAVYYGCSDSELNQTERIRLAGTPNGQSGDAASRDEALLQEAMDRSEKQIEIASKRTEHHFELRLVEK